MKKQQGFTLLEVLIVVVIMAVLAVATVLSIPSGDERELNKEGQRLASLLEIARAKSRANGIPVIFETTENGFKFEGFITSETADNLPTNWLNKETIAENKMLILGPEPIIPAQQIILQGREGLSITIETNGVLPFEVITN